VLGGVILSMVVNRDWFAASDWLAGRWYVKCELESGWTTDVHTNMIIMRDRCDGDVILIVIEVSSCAHRMCPLRSQWINEPDMSIA
jgi:hypothetical protein